MQLWSNFPPISWPCSPDAAKKKKRGHQVLEAPGVSLLPLPAPDSTPATASPQHTAPETAPPEPGLEVGRSSSPEAGGRPGGWLWKQRGALVLPGFQAAASGGPMLSLASGEGVSGVMGREEAGSRLPAHICLYIPASGCPKTCGSRCPLQREAVLLVLSLSRLLDPCLTGCPSALRGWTLRAQGLGGVGMRFSPFLRPFPAGLSPLHAH